MWGVLGHYEGACGFVTCRVAFSIMGPRGLCFLPVAARMQARDGCAAAILRGAENLTPLFSRRVLHVAGRRAGSYRAPVRFLFAMAHAGAYIVWWSECGMKSRLQIE